MKVSKCCLHSEIALRLNVQGMLAAVKEVCDGSLALDARIRALYVLKQVAAEAIKSAEAEHDEKQAAARAPARTVVQVLLQAVDTTDSVLLQHELLYNVGQFGFTESVEPLKAIVLAKEKYDVVSRHEALESIGAIGDASTLSFLDEVSKDSTCEAPIRESAELAAARTRAQVAYGGRHKLLAVSTSAFASVDPAHPAEENDVAVLTRMLMDETMPLYTRYRAMFKLRNIADDESIAALATALRADKSSCLFRHEIAFVLGQMTPKAAAAALLESLADEAEHGMVRHEAAEALGSLAAGGESWEMLEKYSTHPNALVRDSCVVAIDMHRYWEAWAKKEDAPSS